MKKTNTFKANELLTNKQYRAIIILAFYFLFFAVIIVGIRSSLNKKDSVNDESSNKTINTSAVDGFSSIRESNFNYKYTLNVDDKLYIYEGKKYKNKDEFTLTVDKKVKKYVKIDDFSFEIKKGERVLSDKPIYYLDFFDPDILEQIIKNSTNTGDNVYSIDNEKLDSTLKLQLGVNDKLNNSIMLSYDDNIITRIDMDYTNYIKFINNSVKKVFLTLEYKDFGMVMDFDIK